VDKNDKLMLDFLTQNGFKHYIIENFSTAEDMSYYFMETLVPQFKQHSNIKKLRVRVYETADAWAESETEL
jgi:hypothetical protein